MDHSRRRLRVEQLEARCMLAADAVGPLAAPEIAATEVSAAEVSETAPVLAGEVLLRPPLTSATPFTPGAPVVPPPVIESGPATIVQPRMATAPVFPVVKTSLPNYLPAGAIPPAESSDGLFDANPFERAGSDPPPLEWSQLFASHPFRSLDPMAGMRPDGPVLAPIAIVGDFDGDDVIESGAIVGNRWWLDTNHNGQRDADDLWAQFGHADERLLAGDFDGDGVSEFASIHANGTVKIGRPRWSSDSTDVVVDVVDDPQLPATVRQQVIVAADQPTIR